MSVLGEVGEVDKVQDVKQVMWTIPAFSTLSTDVGKFYTSKSFFFAEERLYFRIYPGGERKSAATHVSVFPMKEASTTKLSLKCELGLKWADGSVEAVRDEYSFTFESDGRGHGMRMFFQRTELLRRLAPSDVCTLVCTLKRGDPLAVPSPASNKTFIELEKLSENFEDFMDNKISCDATLVVRGKKFQVHKSILMARSPVFAAMFQHEMAEKETGTVDIPDCDEDSFDTFLKYLYSGRAKDVSFSNALELYRTAHKYSVLELKSFCAKYLSGNLTVEGVTAAVTLADQYDEEGLLSAVQDFFNDHFGEIVVTAEWESLNKRNFRLANKLVVGASGYFSKLKQQAYSKSK